MPKRSPFPLIAFTLSFTGCILFPYTWFNTDLGRLNGRGQMPEDGRQCHKNGLL